MAKWGKDLQPLYKKNYHLVKTINCCNATCLKTFPTVSLKAAMIILKLNILNRFRLKVAMKQGE